MPSSSPTGKQQISLLWHPHQGLWNWKLVGAVQSTVPSTRLRKWLIRGIVTLDTCMLASRALARRKALFGVRKLFAAAHLTAEQPLVHLDIGLHKEGGELSILALTWLPRKAERFQAVGFEAAQQSFDSVRQHLGNTKNVQLVHLALCHTPPADGLLKLYYDNGQGLGDSLYRTGDTFEQVPAARLSSWLAEQGFDLSTCICTLRMNIEGAELDVMRDLTETGLHRHIDGFYGMWDDLSKIDPEADTELQRLLKQHDIRPMTFNGRDLRWRQRLRWIEYDIDTSLMNGARRITQRH